MDGRHRTQGHPPPASGIPGHPQPPTSFSQKPPPFAHEPPTQSKRPAPAQKQSLPQASQQGSQAPIPQLPPQDIVNACDTLVTVARSLNSRPVYDTQRVGGEDHQPLFHASLKLIPQGYSTRGVGHSKLSSRRDAACNMLRIIYSKTVPPQGSAATAATNMPRTSSPSHSLSGQAQMQAPSYPVTQARQAFPIRSYSSVPHPSQGQMPHPGVPQPSPVHQGPGHAQGQFHPQVKQDQLQPQHQQLQQMHQPHLRQQSYQQQQMPRHAYQHMPSQQPQYQPQQRGQSEQEHPQVQPEQERLEQQQEKQQQEEEEPMFYVDRSPDSELERELEEEEEQQKQFSVEQQVLQPPVSEASAESALKPQAPKPEASTAKPTAPHTSAPRPVNDSAPPALRSAPIPVSASGAASSALPSSTVKAAPSAPQKPVIAVAATTISPHPVRDPRVAVSVSPSASVAVPASNAGLISSRQTQALKTGASTAPQIAASLSMAPVPIRASVPMESVGPTSTRPSKPPVISVKAESSVLPVQSMPRSDGNTVPTAAPSLKRKLDHAVTERNINSSTNGAAVEQSRKKAKPLLSNPSVRIEFHFLCVYSDVVMGCLQNLIGADLFMRPVIRMFTPTTVPIRVQFSPSLNVEVKQFSCNIRSNMTRVNVALAFEAGIISNQLWVERAKHLEKGLSSIHWPQLIILHSDPCFDIFKKERVTDVVKPTDDVAAHVSGILQHIANSEVKRSE